MLVLKFSIMIFVFTYFIYHVRYKLTPTYVATLDAVTPFSCLVIEKYYQPF